MRRVALAVLVCLVSSPAFAQRPEVVVTELVELRNHAVANMNEHEVIVGSIYNGTFNVPFRWSAKLLTYLVLALIGTALACGVLTVWWMLVFRIAPEGDGFMTTTWPSVLRFSVRRARRIGAVCGPTVGAGIRMTNGTGRRTAPRKA